MRTVFVGLRFRRRHKKRNSRNHRIILTVLAWTASLLHRHVPIEAHSQRSRQADCHSYLVAGHLETMVSQVVSLYKWSGRRDLNSRFPASKADRKNQTSVLPDLGFTVV